MPHRNLVSTSDYRLLPRYRPQTTPTAHHITHVVLIIDTPTPTGSAGGDTRQLRGIPAIGHGVSGHIAGSQPELACTDHDEAAA